MKARELLLMEAKRIKDNLYKGKLNLIEKRKLYTDYIALIEQAANKESPEAQFELGQHFEDINYWGVNSAHDPVKCVDWYTKACNNNHSEACNSLAHYYELGHGVKKDLDMALSLYNKAAVLGSELGSENHRLLSQELNRPLLLRYIYRLAKKVKLLCSRD
jgi:TPR repeat protein